MFQSITSILVSIIGIGVIIFIHEFGHFLLAKLNKVKVEVFSLGFGKALIGFKKGDTTYQIGIFPLGGFCKMAGEELKDGITGADYEYFSKPPLNRISIAAAGSVFNYIFGVILFSILLLFSNTYQAPDTVIDVVKSIEIKEQVHNKNKKDLLSILIPSYTTKKIPGPAIQAGLKRGDRIIKVDNKEIKTWNDLSRALNAKSGNPKILTVERGEQILNIEVTPYLDKNTGLSIIGVTPLTYPVISEVLPDSPADKAKFLPGDRIIRLNGIQINTANDVISFLEDTDTRYLTVILERNGLQIKKQIILDKKDNNYFLGVNFVQRLSVWTNKGLPLHKAFYNGFVQANRIIVQTVQGLKLMISGKLNWRTSVGGPVKIFDISTRIARYGGTLAFLSFIAMLSVLLGFFNFLPIPPLDGSFVLVFLFEIILNKSLNKKFMEIVQTVGFALLIFITIIVLFNDIVSIFMR